MVATCERCGIEHDDPRAQQACASVDSPSPYHKFPMRGVKLSNEYARAIVDYANIPKAVFAAVAYSFAARLNPDGDSPTPIEQAIIDEWETLHQNGIVPQAPPKASAQ